MMKFSNISTCRDILPGIELKPYTEKIPPDDTFTAEEKTCQLLGETLKNFRN